MRLILGVYLVLSSFLVRANATPECTSNLQRFQRPLYRIVFDNKTEIDLVLNAFDENNLHGSYFVAGPFAPDEKIPLKAFMLDKMDVSDNGRIVRLYANPGRYNEVMLMLDLSELFTPEKLEIEGLTIESRSSELNDYFRHQVLRGRVFDVRNDFRPLHLELKGEPAKSLVDLLRQAPDEDLNQTESHEITYRQNLKIKRLNSPSPRAELQADTPAEMYNVLIGLHQLGLNKDHPIFEPGLQLGIDFRLQLLNVTFEIDEQLNQAYLKYDGRTLRLRLSDDGKEIIAEDRDGEVARLRRNSTGDTILKLGTKEAALKLTRGGRFAPLKPNVSF